MDEDVFRALGDPSRRALLDSLFDRDGQTLAELSAGLEMTRFGVMKHLRVLEEAGLLTTRRVGREKLHYLNPVPIRLIHDRWISKFAEPWMNTMAGLKRELEGAQPMAKPHHVYQIYIRTTPERLWQAITDPDMTEKYYYGSRINIDALEPGGKYNMTMNGYPVQEGEILEADPPRRLVRTVHALFSPEAAAEAPMKHIWEIEPAGDSSCRLSLTLESGTEEATPLFNTAIGGVIVIVSSLKTFLESGETLAAETLPARA